MIILTLLAITLVILLIFAATLITVGGAAFIIVFADVIVCAFIIAWIIKHLINRRKSK